MTIDTVEKKQPPAEEEKQEEQQKLEVADKEYGRAREAHADFATVGRRHTRVEGPDKVTGRARYSYDIHLSGQLYARVLRSPHPHARIVAIDTSAAEALPGVRAVISSANVKDVPWYETSQLFDTTVRFVGDEVAAVAADSIDIAEDALRLIEVEYEVLPFVVDLERALTPGAPLVHAEGNLVDEPKEYARGDIEAGLAGADVVIIEQTYITQTALHNSLEPHGCTAAWEGENLTIWSSTQSVWKVRSDVAEALGLSEQRVRVIKQHMGGGFGAKQIAWKHDAIAALLSRASGRPVQLMLDRESENLATGNRNSTVQRDRIGARRDGTLTAIDAVIDVATGAYQVGGEGSNVAGIYQGLYRCDNVHTMQRGVYLNLGPAVAFRAPGFVEGAFGLESAMDELARALDMDPIELRQKNYTGADQKEDKPYSLPDGLRLCYQAASAAFDWSKARTRLSGTRRRGVGVAAHSWMAGGGNPPGYAWVKINGDGSVDVVTGTQDIGTGTRTALVQIAAEELGVAPSCVAVQLGDTANGPYSPASAGSSTLATIGPAVRAAAVQARDQLFEAAAVLLDTQPSSLEIKNGAIMVRGAPGKRASVEDVMKEIKPHMILGQGARAPKADDMSVHTFGVQIAEVEVDTESGDVTVLQVVASHDCGRIVNPVMVESQVIGGVTQGIGYALTEERVVDDRFGVVLNANLEEYKVPTVADVPPITFAAVDVADPGSNSLGVKGIGEPPLIPTAPAIANAVFDAAGIRIRHAPLSRRRVLAALERQSKEK